MLLLIEEKKQMNHTSLHSKLMKEMHKNNVEKKPDMGDAIRRFLFLRECISFFLFGTFMADPVSTDLVVLCRRTVVQPDSECDSRRRLLLERFPHQPRDALPPSPFILGRACVN